MQRYFSKAKENNTLKLDKEDIRHIRTVMRMNDGDNIEVVYGNNLFICKLTTDDNADILEEKKENEKITEINLIIPVLKETKMDYIFQKGTELGATEFTPVYTERTKVKLDSKKEEKRIQRWSKICKEAAEQSKRTSIPKINKVCKLTDVNKDGLSFVCSTKENMLTIKNQLKMQGECDKISITVGPEGGLSTNEETALIEKGFIPVSLGKRILRAETAPLFVLSVLNYELME